MASSVFNSFMFDLNKGNIDPESDTFWVMLTDGYVPDIDGDTKRSDITNEVVGTGYTADGKVITCTVAVDNSTNRVTLTFGSVSWTSSTIDADGAVIYKRRGGAASADELVAFIDAAAITSSGTYLLSFTNPLIFQNNS